MSSIYGYECIIEEAQRKIDSLEDELSNLYSLKSEVDNGADTIQGQIATKRKKSNDLLMLESKLPLVSSLNAKIQEKIDVTFQNNVLVKFDEAKEEVKSAINKVYEEIEEQKEIIKQYKYKILRIQEEDESRKKAEQEQDMFKNRRKSLRL